MIALRTHVGRVAKRDVREREREHVVGPGHTDRCPHERDADRDVSSGRASAAPPISPPPVFPSRCRCSPPPPPPSPLRILVVASTRRGLSRRSWGHWLAPSQATRATRRYEGGRRRQRRRRRPRRRQRPSGMRVGEAADFHACLPRCLSRSSSCPSASFIRLRLSFRSTEPVARSHELIRGGY